MATNEWISPGGQGTTSLGWPDLLAHRAVRSPSARSGDWRPQFFRGCGRIFGVAETTKMEGFNHENVDLTIKNGN